MTYLPGRAAVRDSGSQPAPHYCTVRVRADGAREGCPDWPHCLFAANAAEPNDEDDTLPDSEPEWDWEPEDSEPEWDWEPEDSAPGLVVSLLSLTGVAAGLFLAVVVAAILLPFIV